MSMLTAQLSWLTRRLGRISLRTTQAPIATATRMISPTAWEVANEKIVGLRSFASKAKKGKGKTAHSTPKVATDDGDNTTDASTSAAALQHQEWVKFQQSIAVEGFETGQTTTVQSTKKTRGGKAVQKKKTKRDVMAEKLAERRRLTGAGGGEFPPLRYSDDETERLLAQAYAALPERAGPRRTRNLKRQKRRWHLVRQIHRKYKAHMANFQTRKMIKRAQKVRDVRAILHDAPQVCQRDADYQRAVYERWAATMVMDQAKVVDVVGEATGQQQQSTI